MLKGLGLKVSDMPDACRYPVEGAKDMPNARHALYLQASAGDIWLDIETTGQLCVWRHLYEPYSGAKALGAGHLSD